MKIINFYNKISFLLNQKQLYGCFLVSLLSIITAFLEILGLSLIFPIINLLVDSSSYLKIKYLPLIFDYLNFNDPKKFSIFILSSFVIIYILKLLLIIVFRYFQYNLTFNIQVSQTNKISKKLLNNNYYYFIKTKSSKFISTILNETELFATGVVSSSITLISEIIVLSTIILFLFFYDLQNTLIIFIFFSVFCTIYFLTVKNKLKIMGNMRQESQKNMYEGLLNLFNAIKLIKLNKKEPEVLSKYEKSLRDYADVLRKTGILSAFPRVTLELIAILSFFTICIYSYQKNINLSNFFATIALYAAASIKLIPSFSKIINEIQSIKINKPVLDFLYDISVDEKFKTPDSINTQKELYRFENKISFSNIQFKYDNKENVLNNLNFELHPGTTVGIYGRSGSGKSTFVDLFLGFLNLKSGSIILDDNKVALNNNNWRNLIGYVPQNIFLFNDSIENNISLEFGDNPISKDKLKFAIKFSQLDKTIENLPLKEKTNIGENGILLSGGERQRLAIARALYKKPKILLFDEPTSSIDKNTETEFLKGIEKLKTNFTILMVTHSLESLKYCDKIFKMENGNLNSKSISDIEL